MGIYAQKKQCHKLETESFIKHIIVKIQHQIKAVCPIELSSDFNDVTRIQFNLKYQDGFLGKRSTPDDIRAAKQITTDSMKSYGYIIHKETPLILKLNQAGKTVLQNAVTAKLYQQQCGQVLSKVSFNVHKNKGGIIHYIFDFIESSVSSHDLDNGDLSVLPIGNDELSYLFRLAQFGNFSPLYQTKYFETHFCTFVGDITEEYSHMMEHASIKFPTAFKGNLLIDDTPYEMLYRGNGNLSITNLVSGKRKYNYDCFKSICFTKFDNAYFNADKDALVQIIKSNLFHFCKFTFPKMYFKEIDTQPGPSRNYHEIVIFKETQDFTYAISVKASSLSIRNHFGEKVEPSIFFTEDQLQLINRTLKMSFGTDKATMLQIIADLLGFDISDPTSNNIVKNIFFITKPTVFGSVQPA